MKINHFFINTPPISRRSLESANRITANTGKFMVLVLTIISTPLLNLNAKGARISKEELFPVLSRPCPRRFDDAQKQQQSLLYCRVVFAQRTYLAFPGQEGQMNLYSQNRGECFRSSAIN